MSKIAVRGYTQKLKKKGENRRLYDIPLRHDRILVFDTETTEDQYQNFKIGHFKIFQNGFLQHDGLFYDPTILNKKEIKAIEDYSKKTT